MKRRDLQSRLFFPAKLSFRIKEQIKSFPDKKKLKEFIITKPSLYERDLFKKKKIKTMSNKMATNTYLSTTKSKNKLSKQEEQRQNHGYRQHFNGCQMGGGLGEWVKR